MLYIVIERFGALTLNRFVLKKLNENTPTGAWPSSCSRSCSPARATKACHDKTDG